MRFEYIEPFVASTMRVLGGVARSPVSRGEVSLAESNATPGEFQIAVALSGDSEGSVVLHMNAATAANLCARLLGAPGETLTPLGMDSLAELANMIAGNAVSALNDQGSDFTVSPPRFVAGGRTHNKTGGLEAFRIPLATDCGVVTIQVTLRTH